uniref:Bestrophin homolog n=1 Tax=Rhabditophanes sp. KR3021 TaxID=114890 RepID=A0AC35U7X2_9BILA
MYAPFKVLLNVLIYILELVFYGVAWVFQKVFGLFRSKGNGNDDNVGLRKKDDDVLVQEITEEYLAEDLNIINSDEKDDNYECALEPHHSDLTSSLHPESTFNSERIQPRIAFDENAIKSEYGDGVHNRPTSTSESGSTPSFDNASFYTQKRNVNPDIINAAYTSTGDNRTNELTHQNLTNPPTPPPPLAESFLKDFYDKQHPSTLIENELTDSQLYSRPTSSCSYTNNYASDAFLPPLTPYSTSPTKNMICKATKKAAEGDWTGTSKNVITLMNDNKNDDNNNDEMHYVFNHLRTNKNNISQTVPFNPVSADFFIGNSVFQPVREVETMRNAFNRKTEEKWRETTSSPSFNNRGYQELSGNCFDGVGNNNNSAIDGNKNYYVTTPSERATPIYALDGPDTSPYNHGRTSRSLSQNPSYLAQPTNWRYNNTTKPFVNTNFHPEVVSCKSKLK